MLRVTYALEYSSHVTSSNYWSACSVSSETCVFRREHRQYHTITLSRIPQAYSDHVQSFLLTPTILPYSVAWKITLFYITHPAIGFFTPSHPTINFLERFQGVFSAEYCSYCAMECTFS